MPIAPEFHGAMLICNAMFTDRERALDREKINSPANAGIPISLLRSRVYFSGFAAYTIRVSNFVQLHLPRLNVSDHAVEIATLSRDYLHLDIALVISNISILSRLYCKDVFSDKSIDDFYISNTSSLKTY